MGTKVTGVLIRNARDPARHDLLKPVTTGCSLQLAQWFGATGSASSAAGRQGLFRLRQLAGPGFCA